MGALLNWLDHRTGYRHLLHHTLYEPIPGGARWRYVWGSTLVFTFTVQVITGVFLWMAYSPSAQTAWESVYYIQHQMDYGWVVRGLHHFAAQAMVVLMVLHFMQVVVDGAYKAPREVNFWLGIVLMLIVLGLSLTGYLLPWDQKGYYATQVATKILGVTPGVGPELQQLVQGGPEYGHHTLTRFFALHAGVLPGLLIAFLALHIYVFRRHAITPADPTKNPKFAVLLTVLFGPVGMFYANSVAALLMFAIAGAAGRGFWQLWQRGWDPQTVLLIAAGAYFLMNLVFAPWAARSARKFQQSDSYFWPDQILKDAVACLAVLAAVMGLTLYFGGAELTAPADPSEEFAAARPEWYFLFLFQFLKIEWVEHMGLQFGAIVVPGAIMAIIVLMPLIGRWKLGHRFNVAFLSALMIGIGWLTVWALRNDWGDAEFLAARERAVRDGHRTVALANAHGIPVDGAQALLRSDPRTQGPKIFARNCAACHRYDGHDGTGRKLSAEPTAADLGNFGTREWLRSLLVNYKEHFAPLERATRPDGEPVGFMSGEMADWSESNREFLLQEENTPALDALAEFIVAQSQRDDIPGPKAELVEQGRELFATSTWPGGDLPSFSSCGDCHAIKPAGADEPLSEGAGEYYPSLTGYGGQEWLRAFIAHPEQFYGENNAMPAFAGRLSEEELDLLVRWMTGDYHHPDEPHSSAE